MHIDFLGLSAFVAIAERGSFGDAAAHLNVSQTAISHRIRKLERDLGQKLLSRTTREVWLTQAGIDLLPNVKATIENLSLSLDALRNEGRKRQQILSIGCLPTIAAGRLPEALRHFQARHPDVNVRVHDNSASEIGDLVQNGSVEFGITLVVAYRWDFETEVLGEDPFILVCSEKHAFASRESVGWSDLSTEPLIRVSQRTGNRLIIDDALEGLGNKVNWRFEVQHLHTAIAMARTNLALAIVPRMSFASADERGLKLIPLHDPTITRQLGIVSRRGAPISPIAEELRTVILEIFKNAN